MRPHELLGKLLASVAEDKCLETLVALLAEWTQKFPYDYRDERMMNHVKHIVARWAGFNLIVTIEEIYLMDYTHRVCRCSNSHLEAIVSQVLSALLQRLTDLEQHEADLRACQTNSDKVSWADPHINS